MLRCCPEYVPKCHRMSPSDRRRRVTIIASTADDTEYGVRIKEYTPYINRKP